jgi:hypothetical protein
MDVASFALAIFAVLLSCVSLTWQIVSWRRSGPRVAVDASQSLPMYDHGAGNWMVAITARNTGRAATTVTGWSLEFPTGDKLVMTNQLPWTPSLPHRLEAHSDATWFIDTDEVKQECAQRGVHYTDLRAVVSLASGEKVKAKNRGIGLK